MSLNLNKSNEDLKKDFEEAVISGKKNQKKIIVVFITVFLVLLVGVSSIIAYFTYQSYVSHVRASNGLKVAGTLNNEYTEIRSTTRPQQRYNVSYSFTVNGKSYSGTTTMSDKPVSKKVVVLYDPENPDNNKLEGGNDFFEEMIIGCAAVLIFAFMFNIFVWAIKKNKNTRNN